MAWSSRRRSLLVATLAAPFAAAARAAGNRPAQIKLGSSAELGPAGDDAVLHFAEQLRARTHGEMRISLDVPVRPSGESRLLQAVQRGTLPMAIVPAGALAGLGVPAFHVLELPALFKDDAIAAEVAVGPLAADLLGRLEAQGLHGVRLCAGSALVLAGERPLVHAEDLAGLRTALAPSLVVQSSLAALGAAPVDVGDALPIRAQRTRATAAAVDLPAGFVSRAPLGSPQLAITLAPLGRRFGVVVANPAFWNGLASEARTAIEAALSEGLRLAEDRAPARDVDALDRASAGGSASVHAVSGADLDAWRRALLPVHREFEARIGRPTVLAAYQAARFAPPY